MKCAVIKILISLIISGICLVAGDIGNQLAITDGPSTTIQSCVAKVIEHILNPSESLVFVINFRPDYIPIRLPNPVTVVDLRAPLLTNYKRYEVNYVIEAKTHSIFSRAFDIIFRSSLWHPKETPKGKMVILIKEEKALKQIFYKMWMHLFALHIIVVTYDDTSKNCPMKIITGNPQAKGNNCGKKPTIFSSTSCNNISLELLKPIRNYNGCPVFIQPNLNTFEFDLNLKRHLIIYNLLAGLKRTLNVIPTFVGNNRSRAIQANGDNDLAMFEGFFGEFEKMESSIIFSRKEFVWQGPPAIRTSSLNTFFLPFNYDLWIAALFITILMILIKWMIMKGNGYNNNYVILACAFTDIIGLTFGVCVNRIPNIWSLKLMLGFFLVYIIHIHTAYTSDLINILTLPRYEGVIKSLEEVANSGFPIFMHKVFARHYFKNVTDGGSLLGRINMLITAIEDTNSINVTNCFIVFDEDFVTIQNSDSRFNSRIIRKRKIKNLFFSNDISGEIKGVFHVRNGSYFGESLNAVITHLLESGIFEADANLNPSTYKEITIQRYNVTMKESAAATGSALDAFSQDENVRPLHLADLLPIFVIFLICLSFCIIIFVAEILVHKIVAHINRNQVVPLNV